MTHDPHYSEGFKAGYAGISPIRNPHYYQPQRNLWFDGHTAGTARRKIDIQAGRHPEHQSLQGHRTDGGLTRTAQRAGS